MPGALTIESKIRSNPYFGNGLW